MRYLLPTVRPILADLTGTLAFYLIYLATGLAWLGATVGLGIGLSQMVLLHRRRRPLPALLVAGVALTAVLGGATVVLHDPRFILVKPSIVCAAIAATMLPRGWVGRYVPDLARELLPAETIDRIGWGWAALMATSAALNLVLVLTLPPRTAAMAFGLWAAGSKIALFAGQYGVLRVRAGRAYLRRGGEGG